MLSLICGKFFNHKKHKFGSKNNSSITSINFTNSLQNKLMTIHTNNEFLMLWYNIQWIKYKHQKSNQRSKKNKTKQTNKDYIIIIYKMWIINNKVFSNPFERSGKVGIALDIFVFFFNINLIFFWLFFIIQYT